MLKAANISAARLPPKIADAVYQSAEFKVWREAVMRRDGSTCKCGRTDGRMFADHVVEIRDGGAKFDVANGQTLCGRCHTLKTNAERARRLDRTRAGAASASAGR